MIHNILANDKQSLELGRFVILPEKGLNVRKFISVYLPPTHIDNLVVVVMSLLQELTHSVD